jgi:hypothetical protein
MIRGKELGRRRRNISGRRRRRTWKGSRCRNNIIIRKRDGWIR